MLDFAYPYLLLLLLAVPAVWLLYWLAQMSKRRRIRKFGNPAVLAHLMPDASKYKPALKITLQLLALVAVVFVLARPRYGEKEQTDTRAGIEVMIAFDLEVVGYDNLFKKAPKHQTQTGDRSQIIEFTGTVELREQIGGSFDRAGNKLREK